MTQTTAPTTTPSPTGGNSRTAASDRNFRSEFFVVVLHLTWQLAIAVLAPVAIAVILFESTETIIASLIIAAIASTIVIWKTMQRVNKLPVPTLSAAEKRKIKQQYEEEDND